MTGAAHIPVLLEEVMAALAPGAGDLMVDGTFGAGGYSRALLAAGAQVIAFDRDPSVVPLAAPLAESGRFRLITAPFSAMESEVGTAQADGVALDIGVSSMQMDEAGRGFSLQRDGPLDMRMGEGALTAAAVVNETEPGELARLFRDYGEERQARRIAAALVRRRAERPFTRTADLADTVERAVGGRRGARIHPATKVFQALRIVVNDELSELLAGLSAAERTLKGGGRLAVVSFHSLEDRIVKTFLTARAGRTGGTSRHAPPAEQGPPPSFTLAFPGSRGPSPAEVAANPRSRSARLRAAVRTSAPAWKEAA